MPSSTPLGMSTSSDLAARQRHALRASRRDELERDRRDRGDVLAARRKSSAARGAAAGPASKQLREDIVLEAAGAKIAAVEVEAASGASPTGAKTLELRRARLAFRVNLAAVEFPALLFVAEDLVSSAHLGEALLRLGFRTLVRMIFLGQLAKSRLYFRGAGRFRHAEHLVGIAHIEPSRIRPTFRRPFHSVLIWALEPSAARRGSGNRRLRSGYIHLLQRRLCCDRASGRAGDSARRPLIDETFHRHRERAATEAGDKRDRHRQTRSALADDGSELLPIMIFCCHGANIVFEAWSILPLNSLSSTNFAEADDPFALFAAWFVEAKQSEINDPEAMALATVDADGLPDVRMVLCKQLDADGVVFYTNAESAKGVELAACPRAAVLFHWKSLRRQARFRGAVTQLDAASADAYFHSRARQSQLGAWASQQSRPLDSRAALEERVAIYERKFGESEIPRPDYWRGFRLAPVEIEFWSDGAFRLHDRVRFTRQGAGWTRVRLFP